MSRVVHFEIQADQPARAIEFYRNAFGWEFSKWEGPMPYWMIKTGPDDQPGINGGLMPRDAQSMNANTIGVKSLDSTISAVEKNGGAVIVPKMPIPRIGWLAYFKDTEGNIFGAMEPDTSAS